MEPRGRAGGGSVVMTLAVDFGGTRIKLGVVRDGVVLARDIIAAESQRGLVPQLPRVKEALVRLCAEIGVEAGNCTGVGVSFPGLMDPAGRRIVTTFGKYEDAPAVDLDGWSREMFGVPLYLENDARIALLGEWRFGAGRGCDDLVMMTIGTGLGAVAMIDGRLLRGRHDQAGVLGGHFTVVLDGRRCSCGNIGCAEAEASEAHLPEIARAHADFATSALATSPTINYATVFRLASEGDRCAVAIRVRSLKVWGAQIVNLIHAYDPARVILGGGVMASADAILPEVRAHVFRHALTPWGKVEVVRAELGDDFALLGGEVLVRERAGSTAPNP